MSDKKCILLLVFCAFLWTIFSISAHAEDAHEDMRSLADEIEAITEHADDLSIKDADALAGKAADALSPAKLWDLGIESMTAALKKSFAVFPLLAAVILLSSVIGIYSDNLAGGGKLLEFACLLGVVSIVFGAVKPVLQTAEHFLEQYTAFMTSSSASLSLLLASGGQAGAAAVHASSSAFTVGLMQILSSGVVLPCAKLVLALGVLSSLSKTLDLSGVISFIRNFCTWGLGVLFAVFGGVHAAAIRISAGADSAAFRGIRFTAARLVPIAGNMLSECFRTVVGAVSVIKGAFGALGIAYLLYLVLPALCTVLAVKFAVLLALFLSKLMGTRPFTGFLESVGGALNILLAVCLFAAVSGIILFASCIETASVF